jgi:hypothetical protein
MGIDLLNENDLTITFEVQMLFPTFLDPSYLTEQSIKWYIFKFLLIRIFAAENINNYRRRLGCTKK